MKKRNCGITAALVAISLIGLSGCKHATQASSSSAAAVDPLKVQRHAGFS